MDSIFRLREIQAATERDDIQQCQHSTDEGTTSIVLAINRLTRAICESAILPFDIAEDQAHREASK